MVHPAIAPALRFVYFQLMSFFGRWNSVLLAVAFLVAAAGCSPMDQSGQDEEKEAHYVLGKSRVNAMNYSGAIEAFTESLEANPHSAPAHYQLAILYDNQDSVADPAAAIYHYQQCLKCDPKFQNADVIAGRIEVCKQKLAENVMQLPSTPATQQQLEKLAEENRRLREQLTQWQAAYYALKTNPPVVQVSSAPQYNSSTPVRAGGATVEDPVSTTATTPASGATTARRTTTPRTSAPRTHTVARGETLASIARSHGISLSALESANPYVNPKKLKAGQVLNLPAP